MPRPGEISLAHCGVLFLDELPEFERRVLEVLREPMESGRITISRAARQAEFPASFQLIAAMNPCPCGYHGHPSGKCRCSPDVIQHYQSRISGPLLDRIDMQIEVAALEPETLASFERGETSAVIGVRVAAAQARQFERQHKSNRHLDTGDIERYCRLDAAGERRLHAAMKHFQWSARAYHRVLRVARTIADLADSPAISASHVSEAAQYRRLLREH